MWLSLLYHPPSSHAGPATSSSTNQSKGLCEGCCKPLAEETQRRRTLETYVHYKPYFADWAPIQGLHKKIVWWVDLHLGKGKDSDQETGIKCLPKIAEVFQIDAWWSYSRWRHADACVSQGRPKKATRCFNSVSKKCHVFHGCPHDYSLHARLVWWWGQVWSGVQSHKYSCHLIWTSLPPLGSLRSWGLWKGDSFQYKLMVGFPRSYLIDLLVTVRIHPVRMFLDKTTQYRIHTYIHIHICKKYL